MSLYHENMGGKTECEIRPYGKRGIVFFCPICGRGVGRDEQHKLVYENEMPEGCLTEGE